MLNKLKEVIRMKSTANSKHTRICAFCRFWIDPANTALTHKYGDIWEYESTIEKPCMKNGNLNKPAWAGCGKFEGKF
ncbi:MAG: hypothetical protein WC155_03715 [Candidatus Cloacimonadales bacterium]